ncbi:MAG: glycosyltransferase family 2 protein [Verrucomicrobiae bacterium]|nr:glycosyltransferase family 2 protein [Verrucomicrobiae bacterium]
MKQAFYFLFYKWFPNEKLCIVMSSLAYFLYCVSFYLKKWFQVKKRIVGISPETALSVVTAAHPEPISQPVIQNRRAIPALDASIIVPVYNHLDLLPQTLPAIVQQKTRYSYEVIMVDDGSTDGARDYVREFEGNPRVKVVLQKNMGIAGARNSGLNEAAGKYVMFVDCDDVVHEDIVEVLLDKAYSTGADIVMGAHDLVKQKNGKVTAVRPNVYPQYNLMGYRNGDAIMNYPGLPWCKVYRRKLFEHVRYFPNCLYEDTIIHWLVFRLCRSFVYVPKVLYEHRWYEGNYSHVQQSGRNIRAIERYWLIRKLNAKSKQMGLPEDDAFYTLLLRHLGSFYYFDVSGLEESIVNAMFVLACELAEEYKPRHPVELPFALKQIHESLLTRNIEAWKLACHYQ